MEESARKTALYDCHVASQGKMVPFAGYMLPVEYEATRIVAEHLAVRQHVGMFDVSHMGEVMFEGKDALSNIQHLLTNDYSTLEPEFVRYSPMCYENGGVVDDLLVYCLVKGSKYLIVVNASNRFKDVEWMQSHVFGDCKITDISDEISQIALQGPEAINIIEQLTAAEDIPQGNYTFKDQVKVGGISCLLSRTGYTGEDGFEIYLANKDACAMFNLLKEKGAVPCGLGARDTLRMEAAMPLYGQEMDETITPWETGLGMFVKMAKEEFIGKDAIQEKGKNRCRIGLKVVGRGIVREHCDVYKNGEKIGHTTSGVKVPTQEMPIAMAIIPTEQKELGEILQVEVRGRMIDCEVVKTPFYKREK